MTEQETIKEAFETIIEMCGKTSCRQCPMSYHDGDDDYLCNLERRPPHACKLREVKVFEPHWKEFEINKEGKFRIVKGGVADTNYYSWWDWAGFLSDKDDEYNSFGGWLYTKGGCRIWSMTPRISVCDSDIAWSEPDIEGEHQNCSMTPRSDVAWAESDIEAKPATPTKIRFWRIKE